jgi:hypothetical protein
MLSRTAIDKEVGKLSFAMLRRGVVGPNATIAGWLVRGYRLYNAAGCVGPSWNPRYCVAVDSKLVASGDRELIVNWLHKNQPQ